MDDARLAAVLASSAEIERAIKAHLAVTESPAEQARGWVAYRNAVGLRKACAQWIETRRWRADHAEQAEGT